MARTRPTAQNTVPEQQREIGSQQLRSILVGAGTFHFIDMPRGRFIVRPEKFPDLLKQVGEKKVNRWVAPPEALLDVILPLVRLDEWQRLSGIAVRLESGDLLMFIEVPAHFAEALLAEFTAELRWRLASDAEAKKQLDAAAAARQKLRSEQEERERQEGLVALRKIAPRLRDALRDLSRVLEFRPWAFSEMPEIYRHIESIAHAREELGRYSRGRIDGPVRRVLEHFHLYAIKECPELLSGSKTFVDAECALGFLQVHTDYERATAGDSRGLAYELLAGYRPHTDIISRLPRSFFTQPRYVAPIEDFLDWAAEEYYAGKRAGAAEDGAIGWVLSRCVDETQPEQWFGIVAEGTKYWTHERLKQCIQTWDDEVWPLLKTQRAR